MKIKTKKLHENAIIPERSGFAAGYDLFTVDGFTIVPGGQKIVSTGISLEIPQGYYGKIFSKSGLSVRSQTEVGAGVIDEDYRDELKVVLYNQSRFPTTFMEKSKIAQIVFMKYEEVEFEKVEDLSETERKGGFGSTGLFAKPAPVAVEENKVEEPLTLAMETSEASEIEAREETREEENPPQDDDDEQTQPDPVPTAEVPGVRKPLKLIVACTLEGGIGKDGKTPWRIKEDMDYFKKVTTSTNSPGTVNAVVMGRITWESIPLKFRPLEGRLNVVISSTMQSTDEVPVFKDMEEALLALDKRSDVESVFICGGVDLYNQALNDPRLEEVHVTKVKAVSGETIECDRKIFIPLLKERFPLEEVQEGSTPTMQYLIMKSKK